MKWAAVHRCLMVALVAGAILLLPLTNLAAGTRPTTSCAHCQMPGAAMVSGHCCCPCGTPVKRSACDHGKAFFCPCSSAGPAVIAGPTVAVPTWQASPYRQPVVTAMSQFFPCTIFHPPEPGHIPFHA